MAFSFLADGRAFTQYGPSCAVDQQLSGNMTSSQYRLYLQKNAQKLIDEDRKKAMTKFKRN